MDNNYSIFTSTMQERSKMGSTNGSSEQSESLNPRQKVLENFKEISRIMTQSFLMQKKIEKRYGK
jgi:hypothetical protein